MGHTNETKILVQEHKLELSKRGGTNTSLFTLSVGCSHPAAQPLLPLGEGIMHCMHCIVMLVLMLGIVLKVRIKKFYSSYKKREQSLFNQL